jgi:hypothetical protein
MKESINLDFEYKTIERYLKFFISFLIKQKNYPIFVKKKCNEPRCIGESSLPAVGRFHLTN